MTKLSRETVIRAALDLLNEVGVDGLSTPAWPSAWACKPALYGISRTSANCWMRFPGRCWSNATLAAFRSRASTGARSCTTTP